ncbi:conserved hypothetical protein [Bradyrhizobium sp. STM 3843]|uniref:hypothetical protein n=1 Tax=unclassified Bradyrhizobium TaxID=2631580 RepID=UPI0002403AA8|nr:hypothetical protein [Bradyrhizobium sp. STM 3843]CCE10893.1 conserved hypothetical protein [Bradyrhizobium sp. STM 3843]
MAAAIVRAFSRVSETIVGASETLKILLIFGLAGLAISLLLASYGLDLSAGFF